MENKVIKTQEEMDKEIKELNEQFSKFLHEKGIKQKFKLAFDNMAESKNAQAEKDRESFEEIKAQSIEDNKEFYEFLQTKGIKEKYKLVIENIKKGAREVSAKNDN